MNKLADLQGMILLETGISQWRFFLTFFELQPDCKKSYRLFIDTDFTITPTPEAAISSDPAAVGMASLMVLSNDVVKRAEVSSGDELTISFATGTVLKIAGLPNERLGGDTWWLVDAYTCYPKPETTDG